MMGRKTKTETPATSETFSLIGDEVPAPTRRRKSKKTETAVPAAETAPQLTDEERAIAEKHGIELKPGSLRFDETRKKKVVTMFCSICKRPRVIATQDCFQVRTCGEPECKKAYKKANQ